MDLDNNKSTNGILQTQQDEGNVEANDNIKEISKDESTANSETEEKNELEQEIKEQTETTQEVENKSNTKEYKVVAPEKRKKEVSWTVATIIISVLVIIILLISTIFALVNLGNENIIDGIKIKGIEMVGLSKEDAKLELQEAVKVELSKNIILKYGDFETTISPEQIESKYDIENAVEEAYSIGRNGNIIKNNYDIILAMLFGVEIEPAFSYNEKSLTDMLDGISKKIPGSVKESSYYIEDDKLIVTNGTSGIGVKVDTMKKQIIEQVKNPTKNYLPIVVENVAAKEINIDKIYEEVKKDPKNAYVSQNPFTVHPEEKGVDFDISLQEARQIIESEKKDEYEIPIKYIEAEVKTSDLGEEAFPDLITQFSTRYDPGLVNRTTNLELSSAKINGTVLMPGEEFSYNKVVGERTIAAGYKNAAIYSGGKVVDGLGGGICQISSTLYNAAVQAGMEITERENHQFVTSYLEAGKDATVVYGYIDFKFKNTRKYPVKITSSVSGGIAEMKIYGVKEQNELDIKLESERISTIPFSVSYIEDSSLESGKEVVEQYGHSGEKTITYKVCRLNGDVVSRDVFTTDTYDAMTKIIRKGTKGSQTVKSTSPQETKNEITTTKNTTSSGTTVTTVPGNKSNKTN